MKATCPKDPNHNRFVTVAHVTEDWIVDEAGNFIELAGKGGESEVVHGPNPGNTWECAECGAQATVTP